jgi:hypothetical protein
MLTYGSLKQSSTLAMLVTHCQPADPSIAAVLPVPMCAPSQQTASAHRMNYFLVAQFHDGQATSQSTYKVTMLTINNSSSVCGTGTVYTATNDKSPIIHVGCGYEDYKALRNGDTNLLLGWDDWHPPGVSAAPTIGFTEATGLAGDAQESAMYATPTPGTAFDPPTEAVCRSFSSTA